jgi:hypothetical protein
MTAYAHDTVPTELLEANDVRFAYRRQIKHQEGSAHGLLPAFMGNLDDHDRR